jgi:peptidyl-prolyl cis-trans isomerase SurA
MTKSLCFWSVCLLLLPVAAAAQDKGQIVEEVVARVNNDVITRTDLENARKALQDEARQDCPACTSEQLAAKTEPFEKDLLRDLIDNSLLVQRGKDMGINVDASVVKQLDQIRQDHKIDSLEDLEKAVTANGEDYEDFKTQIRNQLITQEVIRQAVGSRIVVGHPEVLAYYDKHKQDFVRPEQVVVREIFVSTEGKTDQEKATLQKKADGLLLRVKSGEDFGELAKRFSDGSTAKQGGDLGTFEKGQLAANLEAVAFKLDRGQTTEVLPTKTGFLILQVQEHYASGQQPEEKVDSEIIERLSAEKMKPAMRDYLDMLRQDSYVDVKPGYVDTAEVAANPIEEEAPAADNTQKKKSGRKLLLFGKKKNG